MPAEGPQIGARGHIPQFHYVDIVVTVVGENVGATARKDATAVGRERNGGDHARVPAECPQLSACARIPQLERRVLAA